MPTSMSNGCDRAERGTDVGWQLASREKPHHATQSVERSAHNAHTMRKSSKNDLGVSRLERAARLRIQRTPYG